MSMKLHKRIVFRKCTGCKEMKDKRTLVRIVKTKEGNISIDQTTKQDGRGAYVCKGNECIEKARKQKGIERSFKGKIPKDIYDNILKEV